MAVSEGHGRSGGPWGEDTSSSGAPEVYRAGAGPPLVLLHGVGASWHIWVPVLTPLENEYHVIAPTLPGHPGGIPLADGTEPTVPAIADQLLAQLRGLGIESAHVAGNSLGGWLAVELGRRGFARSVTAFSPAGAWRTAKDFKALVRGLLIPYLLMPLLYLLLYPFMRFGAVRRVLARDTMNHGERVPVGAFRRMLRRFRGCRMMPRLFRNTRHNGGIEPWDTRDVPTRIVWCGEDRVLPFEAYGAPFMARMDGAEAQRLAGAGHVPMYDDPDAVAEAIAGTAREAEQTAPAAIA